LHLLAEPRKIGGKDGGSEFEHLETLGG
jgi:hypothetical protein